LADKTESGGDKPLSLVVVARNPVTQMLGGDLPREERHAGSPLVIAVATHLTGTVIQQILEDLDKALQFAAEGKRASSDPPLTLAAKDIRRLQHPLRYRPDVVMVDNSRQEKIAISAAFNRST
jgi:hypothetical protein